MEIFSGYLYGMFHQKFIIPPLSLVWSKFEINYNTTEFLTQSDFQKGVCPRAVQSTVLQPNCMKFASLGIIAFSKRLYFERPNSVKKLFWFEMLFWLSLQAKLKNSRSRRE